MTKFRLKALHPSEAQTQQSILRYLAIAPRVAWAHRFNTGAHVVIGQAADGKQTRRFLRYAFPGCPDVLGQLRDGRFLAIEVKTKTGKATPEQEAFLALVAANGGVAVLARSVDDVVAALARG
jgi:VRR-NUC domain